MKKWMIASVGAAAALGAAYLAAEYFANDTLRERAEIFAQHMRKHTHDFRYGSVAASALSQSIVMRDVSIEVAGGERINVESLTIKNFDWRNGGRPHHAEFVFARADLPSRLIAEYVRLPMASRDETQRVLDRAGYGRTVGDVHVAYRFDQETQDFELKDSRVDIPGLGTFTLNLKLGNVSTIELDNPAVLMGLALQVTLKTASFSFRDRSLVSRVVKAYALERGLGEAEAHARLLQDLRAERDRQYDPLQRDFIEALARFVERPSELGIHLDPPAPFPLLSLFLTGSDSAQLKQRLGLSIAAR